MPPKEVNPKQCLNIINVWAYFQTELKYHLHYLSIEFQRLGHSNTFLTTDKMKRVWFRHLKTKTFKPGVSDYEGSPVHRIRSFNLGDKPVPIDIRHITRVLRESNVNVLHIFGIGNPFSFAVVFLALLTRRKCLIVANDHSNPRQESHSIGARFYYWFNRSLFWFIKSRVKRVYVPNAASRELIQQRYRLPDDQIKIIPLGFDGSVFQYCTGTKNQESRLVIGFAGKLDRSKRIEALIHAASDPIVRDDVRLIIVGVADENDPYLREMRELAVSKSVEVEFRPLLGASELAAFYNFVDLGVFPGSISITTVEASGCGTPVVVYESIIGLEDRVADGRGYLFKEDDELPELLCQFVRDKKAGTIDNARIASSTKGFSWREIAKLYVGEYFELMTDQANA
jgi:glycosyltransferase involved in cell wall biosynthesis